jgi:mono/diheme cytochrome c family protein
MRNVLLVFLLLIATLLTACGTESGDGDNNPNPGAPFFDPIGTQSVAAGVTISFTVIATDPNNMNITLSADGTVGPNNNPFAAGANFNPGNGNFTWDTDATDVGNYSVRFTVTNDAMPAQSTSMNVTIQVVNPEAPSINAIGSQTVTAGGTLSFTVIANDPNGFNITLSADGTVGPNNNPFAAGASFNTSNGAFTWNTDAMDVGNYSVQFTATNNATPPLSTSTNVAINVLAVSSNTGEDLYNQHCQSCHGTNGVGGSRAGIVQCSLEISIREALGLVQGVSGVGAMSGISLTTQEIQDIANFLQSFPGC